MGKKITEKILEIENRKEIIIILSFCFSTFLPLFSCFSFFRSTTFSVQFFWLPKTQPTISVAGQSVYPSPSKLTKTDHQKLTCWLGPKTNADQPVFTPIQPYSHFYYFELHK